MLTLKSCPWCGHKPRIVNLIGEVQAVCSDESCRGIDFDHPAIPDPSWHAARTREQAIQYWNIAAEAIRKAHIAEAIL